MSLLNDFIASYKAQYTKSTPLFDEGLMGLIQKAQYVLLEDKLSPSVPLKEALNKLHIRAQEPMKVAICGQFSSGKSTFLNALLAKDVLPTGITPVTSKINYIRYGEAFKMGVRYLDGRSDYYDIQEIARFTDQREAVEEIDYLTIYAPLEILKEVIFIDTPGLNADTKNDAQTTTKVLREVDGIIWLTLMDNAGKMSEFEVLKAYLGEYQEKSLCVLNQKDKFAPQEIEEITTYVKSAFEAFFSEVIPISALQALQSRSHDKNVLTQEKLENFLQTLHVKLSEDSSKISQETFQEAYNTYIQEIDALLSSDLSANKALLEDSNINQVFDFIYTRIQPKALESKTFAITKEIKNIASKLITQHQSLISIYEELQTQLVAFESEKEETFAILKHNFSLELKRSYLEIEQMIEVIAEAIYKHVTTQQRVRFAAQKGGLFSQKEQYSPIAYEAPKINDDGIYKILFYEEDIIGKRFKQYEKNLTSIQNSVFESHEKLYHDLQESVTKWQSRYEFIRKSDEVHSDIEFANIRKFASKGYEHILKPFNDEFADANAKISARFSYLCGALGFNYQNATEVCVAFLERKIQKSILLYEENPTQFSLYLPKIDEIKERLKQSFHLHKFENMLNTKRTFLSKEYDRLLERFQTLKTEKITFLEKRKERHFKAIATIEELLK